MLGMDLTKLIDRRVFIFRVGEHMLSGVPLRTGLVMVHILYKLNPSWPFTRTVLYYTRGVALWLSDVQSILWWYGQYESEAEHIYKYGCTILMDKNGRVLISLLIHVVRNAHYCDYCALKHTHTHIHTYHKQGEGKGEEERGRGRKREREEEMRCTESLSTSTCTCPMGFFYNLSLQGKLIS